MPVSSERTDIDISESWVGTSSSSKQPQQVGVGAQVVHDEAGVDREPVTAVLHDVGVRVTAEAVVRLEQRHPTAAREHVAASSPATPLPTTATRSPSWRCPHAFAKSKVAIGSVVGAFEPPDGSTEIAAAVAFAASPASSRRWSPEPLINPAGTMGPPPGFCSQSS